MSESAPGSGAIEGVIGPASATTATHGGAMVPTLALGIPGGLASSFLLSALILKGIAPGPTMLLPAAAGGHLTLVFALVWCTVIASAIGALIGLGSLGWVARLARVRPALLFPVILTFVLIGTVGERHATADLGVLLVLGGLGYAMVDAQVAEGAADARVRARAQWSSGESSCRTRSTAGRGCCARPSWCSRPLPSRLLLAGRRASRRRPDPRPIEREASASRADVVMSACFAAVGAAGLALSLLLTGRPSVFPRIAFGATFACHFCSSLCRGARLATGQPARRSPARDHTHLIRIAWFVFFVANAWMFGLVIGTAASALVYLRCGREGIVAHDARDDHDPGRADVGAGRAASAAVGPGVF